MDIIFIIIGSLLVFLSLLIIIFSKTPSGQGVTDKDLNDLELEYRDLKNQIFDLTKEFNRTANFNTDLLDEKVSYVVEIREDLDHKIMKINKLLTDTEIMCNRLRKLKQENEDYFKEKEKLDQKRLEDEKKTEKENKIIPMKPKRKSRNDVNGDISSLYQKGYTIREIAEKTDKSIGEIEFVIGLQKLR
ncbi:MAG: DUF6115 domain-containing protein [Fusobacteriota bacterium]